MSSYPGCVSLIWCLCFANRLPSRLVILPLIRVQVVRQQSEGAGLDVPPSWTPPLAPAGDIKRWNLSSVFVVCPRSSTRWAFLNHVPLGDIWGRHPQQMPEPPPLALFGAEEQQFELLTLRLSQTPCGGDSAPLFVFAISFFWSIPRTLDHT